MISIGNSLPSLRRPISSMPVPICCASASSGEAQVVGDQPFGEALRDDVRDLLARAARRGGSRTASRPGRSAGRSRRPGSPPPSRRAPPPAARGSGPPSAPGASSAALRTLMSRIAAVTRVRLGAFQRAQHDLDRELAAVLAPPGQLDARADLLGQRMASVDRRSSAISRSAKPSGMMFVTFWPSSSSRLVAELLLGLKVQQHDLAGGSPPPSRPAPPPAGRGSGPPSAPGARPPPCVH